MMKVSFGQTKIFRKPVIGFLHAIVFWGFCIIIIGSIEMIIDGLFSTDRALSSLGPVYNIISAGGDIFAFLIAIAIVIFLVRRLFLNINRFGGIEMQHKSHIDANIALTIILILMLSLLGMNSFYIVHHPVAYAGTYPVSVFFAPLFSLMSHDSVFIWHEISWWVHIIGIFVFVNILPYSKHFHVFMSVPNTFLSRLEPLGYISNMENVTKEVKIMMDPEAAFADPPEGEEEADERFGVLDVEDVTWKNYFDSLACTECGRCTEVCPANKTGKKLSPRKFMIDLRARMKEKGPGLVKEGKEYSDNKSFIRDYISTEELWACTTCNACARECPVNINHPSLIIDMRRYLVMEEAAAPGELNAMFTNIENNGAPWQFSPEDRMLWAEDLTGSDGGKIEVPVMADLVSGKKKPEYLFWMGCSAAYDDRYKKVTKAFVKILHHLKFDYATLGIEESDSGDLARRAGNEMLFQMQAIANIEVMNGYEVKKIIVIDPHDYNTLKNEYPDLGGNYEVIHYTEFFAKLIEEGKLKLNASEFSNKKITYHDPCYLGRANNIYEAPRKIISAITSTTVEMPRNKSFGFCCGAGGGQMFKEAEKGDKEIFIERTEEALETGADIIATSCPFCMTMMTDGLKYKNREEEIFSYDIIELVAKALEL